MTSMARPVQTPVDLTAALQAAAGGDRCAFTIVVAVVERPLRRYLALRAPATVDVDELAQQTLIQAFDALPRWRGEGDPAGWLFGIARNVVRRAWRAEQRAAERRGALEARLAERLAERAERPASDDDARLAALAECEAQLSERWRAIVGWHYREGWALDRIAAELDNAVGTVGATLFRIRARLRGCVEERLR